MMAQQFPEVLLHKLQQAKHIVFFSGAGISAESGIPTFRDALTGLWANFKAEEMASPEGFRQNPKQVWDWYQWRRDKVMAAQPNAAHLAIAALEMVHPDVYVITQNIDGLHQVAGSKKVIELHGSIRRVRCWNECLTLDHWEDDGVHVPCCSSCGEMLRPDVVWFGESLPGESYGDAKEVIRRCDALFSIGTSSLIYPAAIFPFEAAERGATVVQINPDSTELDAVTPFNLRGQAGEILPELIRAMCMNAGI